MPFLPPNQQRQSTEGTRSVTLTGSNTVPVERKHRLAALLTGSAQNRFRHLLNTSALDMATRLYPHSGYVVLLSSGIGLCLETAQDRLGRLKMHDLKMQDWQMTDHVN